MNNRRQPAVVAAIVLGLVVVVSGVVLLRTGVWRQPPPATDPFERVKQLQHKPEAQGYTASEFHELVRLASDPDPLVRTRAITAMFRVQTPEQKKQALEVMHHALNDPHPLVRQYAVSGIGRLGSAQDIPALRRMLSDPAPLVRQGAERALQKLGYESEGGGGQ